MKSGFPPYKPSGRCDRGALARSALRVSLLFAAAGWVYQQASDRFGGGGGASVAGFVSFLALLFGTSAVVRRAHCRDDGAGMATGVALGATFLAVSWGVALRNASVSLAADGFDGAGLEELFRERHGMRDVPWLAWIAEGFAFVFVPAGAASSEADKPYCEDVGRWAEARTLGVAHHVDGAQLRRRALEGDLVGLFTVAARQDGRDKARFALLTAPKSSQQFLSLVLLETPTTGKNSGKEPADDDPGTEIVEAASITPDEREALALAFPGAALDTPPAA